MGGVRVCHGRWAGANRIRQVWGFGSGEAPGGAAETWGGACMFCWWGGGWRHLWPAGGGAPASLLWGERFLSGVERCEVERHLACRGKGRSPCVSLQNGENGGRRRVASGKRAVATRERVVALTSFRHEKVEPPRVVPVRLHRHLRVFGWVRESGSRVRVTPSRHRRPQGALCSAEPPEMRVARAPPAPDARLRANHRPSAQVRILRGAASRGKRQRQQSWTFAWQRPRGRVDWRTTSSAVQPAHQWGTKQSTRRPETPRVCAAIA